MGLSPRQVGRRLELKAKDPLVDRYLRGETLMVEGGTGLDSGAFWKDIPWALASRPGII